MGPLHVKLIVTGGVTQEGVPILAGKHSSLVHICAMEYWELVTFGTYAKLS